MITFNDLFRIKHGDILWAQVHQSRSGKVRARRAQSVQPWVREYTSYGVVNAITAAGRAIGHVGPVIPEDNRWGDWATFWTVTDLEKSHHWAAEGYRNAQALYRDFDQMVVATEGRVYYDASRKLWLTEQEFRNRPRVAKVKVLLMTVEI